MAIMLAYEKFYPIMRGKVTIKTTCSDLAAVLRLKEKPDRINRY